MATSPVTRYHGRLNATVTPNRKEWRQVGRSSLVVAGGTVTPGSDLAITLVASPATPTVGQTVTLTAATSGGVGPYVRTFSQVSGPTVTLSGTGGTLRTFVATPAGSRVFRVRVVDDEASVQEATVTVTTAGAPVGEPLFAGHIPNRVIIGYAASGGNPPPEWEEARTIIQSRAQQVLGTPGAAAYEWRLFTGTQSRGNDLAELKQMLARVDAVGVYPWISCKVTGNDWAGVAAGNYPAIPAMWRALAADRRASGKGPFMATMHHEPRGDAPTGQDLSDWSAMHVYMSNAVAADNDIMAWSAIGNGFLWNQLNPPAGYLTDRNQTFSQAHIDTFRENKHVIAVDTYDDGYPAYAGQETVPSGLNVRVSVKLLNFINYMRARNCGALGIGEWSTLDGAELPKVWKVYRENRDILAISNYYNTLQNSQWDWRLIPANYPDNNATALDYGGTALTDARLTEYVKMLAESISPTYTGPL